MEMERSLIARGNINMLLFFFSAPKNAEFSSLLFGSTLAGCFILILDELSDGFIILKIPFFQQPNWNGELLSKKFIFRKFRVKALFLSLVFTRSFKVPKLLHWTMTDLLIAQCVQLRLVGNPLGIYVLKGTMNQDAFFEIPVIFGLL